MRCVGFCEEVSSCIRIRISVSLDNECNDRVLRTLNDGDGRMIDWILFERIVIPLLITTYRRSPLITHD